MTALGKSVALIAMLAVLSSACSDAASSSGQPAPRIGDLGNAPAAPDLDSGRAEVGRGLYTELCASCHGADLAGDPDWKTPNPDGSYPPPPHDSTGHTWHHSDRLLVNIVRNGSGFEQSRMPTFSDLSVEQVLSIVEYLKTTWGPEERAFQWQVTWQETQTDD